MRLIFVIVFVFAIAYNLYSQKEGNIWYFDEHCGIDFTNGYPVELMDCGLNSSSNSSVISDQNGKLLFYTDGTKVLDKHHRTMQNGNILRGSDFPYSGGCIIVRKPGKENIFYIFSVNRIFERGGLQYSIVHLDSNKGSGKVTETKIQLVNSATPHLTAISHKNGKDFWIVTREDYSKYYNRFHAYLINENGVNHQPVISNGKFYSTKKIFHGQMKISPNGKYLLFVGGIQWIETNALENESPDPCSQELYDFDTETGIVSNPRIIGSDDDAPNGVEFSPDSKHFFIAYSRIFNGQIKNDNRLEQFRINQMTGLLDSSIVLFRDTVNLMGFYRLQLAADGKIYLSQGQFTKYLGVINKPCIFGTDCNFIREGFEITHGQTRGGLPLSVQSYYMVDVKIEGESHFCVGDSIVLTPKFSGNFANPQFLWRGPNNFQSTSENCIIDLAELNHSGTYHLTVVDISLGIEINTLHTVTIISKPLFKIISSDTIIKCENTDILLYSSSINVNYQYSWSTGESTSTITIKNPGKYFLTISDNYGCKSTDSIMISENLFKPEIEIIGNNPACDGDTVLLRTTQEYEKYEWSTGDSTREIITTKSMYCTVSVIDSFGCAGTSDEVYVIFNSTPKTILKGIDRVCLGAEEKYFINSVNKQSVLWEISGGKQISNSGTDTITVKWDKPGQGKVVVKQISSNGCIGKDSIEVFVVDDVKPEILPKKTIICGNGNLTLSTLEKYAGYEWSTGETTEQITVSTTGEYWVLVKDIAGCEGSDTVQVTQANEPQPNITGNLFLCDGETTVLSVSDTYESYLWNTGETTKSITVSIPGTYSVEVTDSNGCKGSASIEVKMIDIEISGLNDLDFGRIGIGFSSEKNLILKNLTNEPVTINRIYSKAGVNAFDLTTNPALPLTLAENGNIEIDIDFEPKDLQEFVDSIIVEITEPCELNLTSELRGIGTAKMLVWLPHLYYPVDTNICIPITAKLISNNPLNIETQFNTTISYEMSAFYPNIPFQKVGDEIHVKLENQELNISTSNKVIGEICGGVMLANQRTTDLLIKEFTTINPYLDIETQNGSLTIDGCVIDLSRIKIFEPFNIVMMPNPASDEITLQIKSHDASLCKIIFYNSLGMEVKNININLISGMNELKIDVNDLSGGVYIIVINDGAEVRKQMFIKE
jgi:hypothetical protein